MAISKPKRLCLYCGEPTKKGRRGEHIVPEAIGGALTLNDVSERAVCTKCNSGVLSQLDKELCSRSFLSIMASQEIDSRLWQAWDVDHTANNLLIEARPVWALDGTMSSLVCYPQIIFDRRGPDVRGDYEEFSRFGRQDAVNVLFKAVRECFGRYRSGEKRALHLDRVRSGVLHDRYRLPPRIFTRHSVSEIAANIKTQSFILRFAGDEDKQRVLESLPNLGDGSQLKTWNHHPGSRVPAFGSFFDPAATMRALMKLALNLVAAYCPNTPVNSETFSQAISVIRNEAGQIPLEVWRQNGFAHAEDLQSIKAPGNAHSFRLVHMDQKWHVFSSFFGGKIGSYVRVPGPNHEPWRCADLVAPLWSKDWQISTCGILPHMKVHVEWNNLTAISPTFKVLRAVSSLIAERATKRAAGT